MRAGTAITIKFLKSEICFMVFFQDGLFQLRRKLVGKGLRSKQRCLVPPADTDSRLDGLGGPRDDDINRNVATDVGSIVAGDGAAAVQCVSCVVPPKMPGEKTFFILAPSPRTPAWPAFRRRPG